MVLIVMRSFSRFANQSSRFTGEPPKISAPTGTLTHTSGWPLVPAAKRLPLQHQSQLAPPVYRPVPPSVHPAPVGIQRFAAPAQRALTQLAPPVYRPVASPVRPTHVGIQQSAAPVQKTLMRTETIRHPAVQCKGKLLSQMAMTRLTTTNSKTVAEFTLDGVSIDNVENSSVSHNIAFHASIAQKAKKLKIPYEGLAQTDKAPHAEDKILDRLFDLGRNLATKKTLSIRMNKAPCRRCATNLKELANKYSLLLRFKVGWISTDGWEGIRVLAENNIAFRYWTEEDRAEKIWAGNHKSNFQIPAREEAVRKMSRGADVANSWKENQTEDIRRLKEQYPFWAMNATDSWKKRGMSAQVYRNITLSQAEATASYEDITMTEVDQYY